MNDGTPLPDTTRKKNPFRDSINKSALDDSARSRAVSLV